MEHQTVENSCDQLSTLKYLTEAETEQLERQNSRLVPEFKAAQLEANARKHWDIFYKRNDTRFFRDRHWTTREFVELISSNTECSADDDGARTEAPSKRLLEVGCGVGNFVFPLIEDKCNNYFIFACDFSERAIEFVKQNELYDESYMHAFQCDITTHQVFDTIKPASLDIISMIFVLSAIHPDKFAVVFENVFSLLKPGGIVLFRDYGRFDMAQLRFKPGNKIADNFYMRQDGTRSYYFAEEELIDLANRTGFEVVANSYVHRKTINVKENVDSPRIFLQGKYRRPMATRSKTDKL